MFAARYFAGRYFPRRYFPAIGAAVTLTPPEICAADGLAVTAWRDSARVMRVKRDSARVRQLMEATVQR